MTATKSFPTEIALTAAGPVMLVDGARIREVFEALEWMAGEPVFTHQFPRVSREAEAVMRTRLPDFDATMALLAACDHANVESIKATLLHRYGPTIDLPRMSVDEHARIDPVSEIAEKVHPSRIFVVNASTGE